MNKWYKRALIAAIIIAILIWARCSGIGNNFTLAMFKQKQLELVEFVKHSYWRAVVWYIAIYIVAIALALPAATVLTVAGGFLFGTIFGALYANIAATIGAIISFLTVRYLIGKPLQQKYAAQLTRFNRAMKNQGAVYLVTVHFIALVPFFLINLLAGLTNVPLWTFIWTTSVGILPGGLVYAFAGRQIHELDSIRDIFSPPIIAAFLLVALLALMPALIKRCRNACRVKCE